VKIVEKKNVHRRAAVSRSANTGCIHRSLDAVLSANRLLGAFSINLTK
jgi:hypothetical protein